MWDEIKSWHAQLVQDLHLHERDNLEALKHAEQKVSAYISSLDQGCEKEETGGGTKDLALDPAAAAADTGIAQPPSASQDPSGKL